MWQLNIWRFKNHQRALQPPKHITELQRDLMKWAVRREQKGLDSRPLHTAIYYLNDYKQIVMNSEMVEESMTENEITRAELPNVPGFISRL